MKSHTTDIAHPNESIWSASASMPECPGLAGDRDEEGRLHERSAVCAHLGCIVSWNDSGKTWDCPCHGSRYDRFGTVVSGPANRKLKPVEGD